MNNDMAQAEPKAAAPEFNGTKAVKELAERVFQAFTLSGRFYPIDAPITLTEESLLEFLNETGKSATANALSKAVDENDHIFQRSETDDGVATIVTTRRGIPPGQSADDSEADSHTLQARFTTPEAPRKRDLSQRAERLEQRIATSKESAEPVSEFAPDSWQAAVAAALREAADDVEPEGTTPDVRIVDSGQRPTPTADVDELGVELEGAPTVEPIVEAEEPVTESEEPPEEVVTAEEPAAEELEGVEPLDVVTASDAELAAGIEDALAEKDEIVRWGDTWMAESDVARLSRGDIRRLQEFLSESDEPLPDVELVQDLRGVMPGSDEFESARFALNYRMSRETKDFEFVGTAESALWTSRGLTPIGTDKRKAADIGHDFLYLQSYRQPSPEAEEGIVEHVLTLYEFRLGVLPYDADLATLLPPAAFDDQRATRLTFESPQTLETFEIELRYPTENRGGYLVGFEQFFGENLVPGAVVTIEGTDSETHFIVEYFQMSRQDRKLLQLDERKNTFAFKQTTYYCATQDEMLLDENHFEQLKDTAPLSDAVRRHPEQVVAKTFERVGEQLGTVEEPRYQASFFDLLAAANIERPISAEYLRDILTGPGFSAGDEEDVYIHEPA